MTDRERLKNANHRLAMLRHAEEVTGNVAMTCRYYGITGRAFYTSKHRYEDGGLEAPSGPIRSAQREPNATDAEVVEKILYLRKHPR